MSRQNRAGLVVVGLLVVMMLGCGGRRQPAGATATAPAPAREASATAPGTAGSEEALSGEVVNGVREVKVEARRWEFVPNRIVVKRGEPVRIIAKSTDVAHGFGLSAFNINEKLPPNKEVKIEFTPDEAGEFEFHCTVYCGEGHDRMRGTLAVKE